MRQKKRLRVWCLLLIGSMIFLSGCGEKEIVEATTEETEPSETAVEEEVVLEDTEVTEYAAIIRITINPELELFVDANHTIVAVKCLNSDAESAFSKLTMTGISLEEAMKLVVETSAEEGYLENGKTISVDIVKADEERVETQELINEVQLSVRESLSEKQMTVELELAIAGEKQEVEETQTQQAVNTEEENVQQCSACGGTGKCEECKGDGYRGSGYAVSCPRCHGTLTETCIYCNESGQSTKHEGTCDFPNCMGAHVYACTICNGGSTPVTCESCGGSGACSLCNGTGKENE